MPHQTGLLRRKDRWYLNIRVPKELRPLYSAKEFIRKALGTSDYREATRELRFRACEVEAEFDERRRVLKAKANAEAAVKVQELSDREAHRLVFRFLSDAEKLTEEWWAKDGSKLDAADREEY